MPLPFDFEGKGFLDFFRRLFFFIVSIFKPPQQRSQSPPTSTSTLSSSFSGGGGFTHSAAVSGKTTSSSVGVLESGYGIAQQIGSAVAAASGGAAEDWEMVLSDSASASPGQEQSILRWIMGDVEEPSMELNDGAPVAEFEFSGDINVLDQGLELDPVGSIASNMMGNINPSLISNKFAIDKLQIPPNPVLSNNLTPTSQFQPPLENTTVLINHHQAQPTQNPSFFLPFPYPQTEPHPVLLPPAKRHNPSIHQQQPHLGPHNLQGMRPKSSGDEVGQHQNHHRDTVVDQLYKAAEQVRAGNSPLAQAILARLNQLLSPIGKPFHRSAFFCKEALQLLLHTNTENRNCSPFNLILKIDAYKSFAEMSPLIQFTNFTCNQAILEALEGFDRIRVIDFNIGYGGQWASLMQELALRSTGAPALKITAFASPSTHDQLELGLTAENLTHFAGEIKMGFEFEISSLDCLNSGSWPLPFHVSEHEAIAVNLPLGLFANSQLSLSMILRFVKQLSPKIVVSVDRGCDRTDLQFPNHVIHTLQAYSNLLESLDAVNVNPDALQKIERFLIQADVEKTIMGRYRSPERIPHWRNLFLSSQFSPLAFSNFTESQAECVVKRTPVRGFHVEKRQNSLVLCWQQKELVSASAWRC